jgi:hypothetical protein
VALGRVELLHNHPATPPGSQPGFAIYDLIFRSNGQAPTQKSRSGDGLPGLDLEQPSTIRVDPSSFRFHLPDRIRPNQTAFNITDLTERPSDFAM